MKTLIITAATAMALSTAAFADGHVAALLAMSNNSAAELLVGETSMGDITAAQVSLALGNMSAAEREAFFESNMSSRMQILDAQMKLISGDSAAEGS